jgi:hypothetical protein
VPSGLLLICSLLSVIWISGMAGADSSSQGSDQGESPTNFGLLKITLEEAIEEVCDRLSSHGLTTICLESPSDFDGRWLVDQILTEQLLEKGYRVVLPDSLPIQSAEICSQAGILRYHAVQLSLDYGPSRRQHLFGPRLVERQVQLYLFFQLSRATGEVIWADEVKRNVADWIPQKDLPLMEQETLSFLSPRLETDGWSRLAEPALLTVVIGGLIYLFYSTQ